MTGPSTVNVSPKDGEKLASMISEPDNLEGWDIPPPLAFPSSNERSKDGWTAFSCRWKTPQRMLSLCPKYVEQQEDGATDAIGNDEDDGSLFCAPLIVCNYRYIVAAIGPTILLYGTTAGTGTSQDSRSISDKNLFSLSTRMTTPLASISLNSDEAVDQSSYEREANCAVSNVIQMTFHEKSNILYVLTVESLVFQIKVVDPILSDSFSGGETSESNSKTGIPKVPIFRLLQTVATKEFRVTCMSTLHDGGGDGVDIVCLGFDSGLIQGWSLQQNVMPSLHNSPRKKGKFASLRFKGYFWPSIRTLGFFPRTRQQVQESQEEQSKEKMTPDTSNKPDGSNDEAPGKRTIPLRIDDHYLMVVTRIDAGTTDDEVQQPTSSMIDFLDMMLLSAKLKEIGQDEGVSLTQYAVPSTPGMELFDSITIPLSDGFPKRVPILESHCADSVTSLTSDDKSESENPRLCVALSDATVALVSCNPSMKDAVGISDERHQIALSYPAIGSGKLTLLINAGGEKETFVACCLRGGTCYMIPTVDREIGNQSITAIPFPQDICSDLNDIYVQTFTAGNLYIEGKQLPVLIYGWSKGVIDIYCFELMRSEYRIEDHPLGPQVSRKERQCLQNMIDTGTTQVLAQIIDEARQDSKHPLLNSLEWKEMLQEVKSSHHVTVEALCSNEFNNLRKFLLSMAAERDNE